MYYKQCHKRFYNKAKIERPWYFTLKAIRQRCNDHNSINYKDYGGKGIKCLITESELKELWFRDKAFNMKEPSIDRKKNNKNYTFENCRYIEKRINTLERNNRFKKSILQFDLNGNFIKEWDCIGHAEKFVSGKTKGKLAMVAKGLRKSAFGFIWKYKE